MKVRLGNVLSTSVAVGVGVLALLAYFVDGLAAVRVQLLAWGGLLAAVAVLIGVLNLLRVHTRKMTEQTPGWPYSLFTFLGFLLALIAALAAFLPGQGGPTTNIFSRFLFQHVIEATSAALAALLVFILIFAGYRLMRRPPTLVTVVFLVTAAVSLIAMAPEVVGLPDFGLRDLGRWLSQVPAVAGARGLALGIALGIIATGLRLLLALDRPYGD